MNNPNLPTVSLYTLTLRKVIHREALIYTMPTVAAGGGHILNIDFFCCEFVKKATGQRAAHKDKYPSDNEGEQEGREQGEETIPKQVDEALADSVAEALADTQAELVEQSAIPSAGKESGKESADSAKLQSDGALDEVIK